MIRDYPSSNQPTWRLVLQEAAMLFSPTVLGLVASHLRAP